MALTAAAAVTTRVRLLSDIVILPLRSVGLAAKESLSVHRISGGRLSFGVGIGGHGAEDYDGSSVVAHGRPGAALRAADDRPAPGLGGRAPGGGGLPAIGPLDWGPRGRPS